MIAGSVCGTGFGGAANGLDHHRQLFGMPAFEFAAQGEHTDRLTSDWALT